MFLSIYCFFVCFLFFNFQSLRHTPSPCIHGTLHSHQDVFTERDGEKVSGMCVLMVSSLV